MIDDLVASNKVIFIEELNVVEFDNNASEISIYLGNIDIFYFDKDTREYVVILTSGTRINIEDEGAGYIVYKLWLDFLNGNEDSQKLNRTVKFEWKSD